MTDITCRLTAKNRDQPRNPTLGYRVYFFIHFGSITAGLVQIDRPKHKHGKYYTITILQNKVNTI